MALFELTESKAIHEPLGSEIREKKFRNIEVVTDKFRCFRYCTIFTMGEGSSQKPKITKRLQMPPAVASGTAVPVTNVNQGCRDLQRLEIEDNGAAYDPVTDRRFEFNLRGLSIVQELQQNQDLNRLFLIYGNLYGLSSDAARAEVDEFLARLEQLQLYRPRSSTTLRPMTGLHPATPMRAGHGTSISESITKTMASPT